MNSPWEAEDAVCAECMENDFFQEFIRERARTHTCSYCGREAEEPLALDVTVIVDRIQEGLESEYEDAANSVPYSSREGGYLVTPKHTREVLFEVGFYAGDDELHDTIVGALPDRAWVERDWQVGLPQDVLRYSWERFSKLVKHHHRYLFFPDDEDERDSLLDPYTPPGEMLEHVGALVRDRNLVAEIEPGTQLFRVRIGDPENQYSSLSELCSAPISEARFPNRMSPAGVSAFYASFSSETAIEETDEGTRPAVASVGQFRTTEPVLVVDFTDLPSVPSLFDQAERRADRPPRIFLRQFVGHLTRLIQKDGRHHVEYVPSQVVTEYLRDRWRDENGNRPSGLRYPSAAGRDGNSVVLFYTHRDFTGEFVPADSRPPLQLEDVSYQTL